ncbi:MAG: hypothetical protein JO370_17135, partial [Paucibacter sp.]|nr:hypothetical protein [Roseateles sp.]
MKTDVAHAMAWGLVLALCAGLAACGKTEEEKRRDEEATLTRLAEKYVREKVREPD